MGCSGGCADALEQRVRALEARVDMLSEVLHIYKEKIDSLATENAYMRETVKANGLRSKDAYEFLSESVVEFHDFLGVRGAIKGLE